jgi:tetratricopeptide (TPR) repeat protein
MGVRRAPFLVVLLAGARLASTQEAATTEATFRQGVAALKAGRLEEAETAFRRVLAQGGHEPYVHNNLAIVYQQQGRHREAVAECREAIRLDPAYAAPRAVLGGSLLALGRLAEAITALEAAVKLLPKEGLAREQLARAYERAGRPAAAIEQYRALREMAPGDPESAYQLGRAYLRLSEWAMQRLRDIDPGSARIYQALGHNYRVQGRMDLAVRAFELAAKADPRLPEIHLALARIHLEQKNRARAREEIERELALVPESAGALELKRRLEAEEKP